MGFSAYSRLKQSMYKQQTRLGSTIAVIVFGASANLSVASEVIDYAQM